MSEANLQRFSDFWLFYLSQHQHPLSRLLHYCGTLISLMVLLASWWLAKPLLILLALVSGYGPAWIGHFYFEKNRPATFRYPFYSLFADYYMCFCFITGRLPRELRQLRQASGLNANLSPRGQV